MMQNYSSSSSSPLRTASSHRVTKSSELFVWTAVLALAFFPTASDAFAYNLVGMKSGCMTELDTSEVIMNHKVVAASESDFPLMKLILVRAKEQSRIIEIDYNRTLPFAFWIRLQNPYDELSNIQYVLETKSTNPHNKATFAEIGGCEDNRRAAGKTGPDDLGIFYRIEEWPEPEGEFHVLGGWASGHEKVRLTEPLIFRRAKQPDIAVDHREAAAVGKEHHEEHHAAEDPHGEEHHLAEEHHAGEAEHHAEEHHLEPEHQAEAQRHVEEHHEAEADHHHEDHGNHHDEEHHDEHHHEVGANELEEAEAAALLEMKEELGDDTKKQEELAHNKHAFDHKQLKELGQRLAAFRDGNWHGLPHDLRQKWTPEEFRRMRDERNIDEPKREYEERKEPLHDTDNNVKHLLDRIKDSRFAKKFDLFANRQKYLHRGHHEDKQHPQDGSQSWQERYESEDFGQGGPLDLHQFAYGAIFFVVSNLVVMQLCLMTGRREKGRRDM